MRETKTQLPLSALKKVWGEAVSYICGLRDDYSRLFQGQRAAMYVYHIVLVKRIFFKIFYNLLLFRCVYL